MGGEVFDQLNSNTLLIPFANAIENLAVGSFANLVRYQILLVNFFPKRVFNGLLRRLRRILDNNLLSVQMINLPYLLKFYTLKYPEH